jgi:hypothetical protein
VVDENSCINIEILGLTNRLEAIEVFGKREDLRFKIQSQGFIGYTGSTKGVLYLFGKRFHTEIQGIAINALAYGTFKIALIETDLAYLTVTSSRLGLSFGFKIIDIQDLLVLRNQYSKDIPFIGLETYPIFAANLLAPSKDPELPPDCNRHQMSPAQGNGYCTCNSGDAYTASPLIPDYAPNKLYCDNSEQSRIVTHLSAPAVNAECNGSDLEFNFGQAQRPTGVMLIGVHKYLSSNDQLLDVKISGHYQPI